MSNITYFKLLMKSTKIDNFNRKHLEQYYNVLNDWCKKKDKSLDEMDKQFYEYLLSKIDDDKTFSKKEIEDYYSSLNYINNDDDIDDLISITKNLSLKNEESINELIEKSPLKKWIKKIDFDTLIAYDKYEHKDNFKHVANILLDNDLDDSGNKKRQTLIKFDNIISLNDFSLDCEWVYIFTIDNKIVKIGGTRNSLKGRVGSYLCGHHIPERKKSGDCSKTNGFIYNTFEFYLNLGYEIKMYGYKLPEVLHETEILNEIVKIKVQTYHAYESKFLDNFKSTYGKYPLLSDNADPNYKKNN